MLGEPHVVLAHSAMEQVLVELGLEAFVSCQQHEARSAGVEALSDVQLREIGRQHGVQIFERIVDGRVDGKPGGFVENQEIGMGLENPIAGVAGSAVAKGAWGAHAGNRPA